MKAVLGSGRSSHTHKMAITADCAIYVRQTSSLTASGNERVEVEEITITLGAFRHLQEKRDGRSPTSTAERMRRHCGHLLIHIVMRHCL